MFYMMLNRNDPPIIHHALLEELGVIDVAFWMKAVNANIFDFALRVNTINIIKISISKLTSAIVNFYNLPPHYSRYLLINAFHWMPPSARRFHNLRSIVADDFFVGSMLFQRKRHLHCGQ